MDYESENNLYWKTKEDCDNAVDVALMKGFMYGIICTILGTFGILWLFG